MEFAVHCPPRLFPGSLARMRQYLCLCCTLLICAGAPALAQVTVDLHALDALPVADLRESSGRPSTAQRSLHHGASRHAKPKRTRADDEEATATPSVATTSPAATRSTSRRPRGCDASACHAAHGAAAGRRACADRTAPAGTAGGGATATAPISQTAVSAATPKATGLQRHVRFRSIGSQPVQCDGPGEPGEDHADQ